MGRCVGICRAACNSVTFVTVRYAKDWKRTGRILIIFLIGSVGTACGALLGYAALHNFIPELDGLAGVFTGTYIGGTVNFAALGAAFEVSGDMISAATVADNLLMALYFFVLIAMPSIGFFRKHFKHPYVDEIEAASASGTKKKAKRMRQHSGEEKRFP